MSLLFFVWFPAAGFFSAASYRRRSGQPLTVKSGAKLGWLTGVIAFAISLLLWAISSFLPGSASFSAGIVTMQEQFAANGQEELARQLGALLENSAALAILFLLALICTFGIIASCTTAGGALGGRILRKR